MKGFVEIYEHYTDGELVEVKLKHDMLCPYCKKEAKFGPNEEFYGKRYGKSYLCYYCLDCRAYVGTHNNTEKPLGTMANTSLRKMRQHVHGILDPLWKSGKMSRRSVYQMLSDKLGRDVHVGWSNEEECKEIIRLLS